MTRRFQFLTGAIGALVLATGTAMAGGGHGHHDANYCMDVEIEPFHLVPDGSCAVRDYLDGLLQEAFYPFTVEDHLFNCEYFGPMTPLELPTGELVEVPSSVAGEISGTIDGHDFTATLLCASLTNWYQDSCTNPDDPMSCTFQLAQPFLSLPEREDFYPRVTEVSVFDGVITVEKGKKTVDVPIVMATRAAGITHVEDLTAPLVGASITHSLLGLITDEDDRGESDDNEVLEGSADLLLQGHIFFPGTVEEDTKPDGSNAAAVIKGTICSKDLYKLLNKKGKKNKKDDDDD
jgi:hypothetical protein